MKRWCGRYGILALFCVFAQAIQLFPVESAAKNATLPKLLPRVPPERGGAMEFAHPPYVQGLCATCHERDDQKDPGPAKAGQTGICFTCHVDLLNAQSTSMFLHEPFEKNCQYCHNPHNSSRPGLLIAQPLELCSSCHKSVKKVVETAKVQHGAISLKSACTNCHEPHGGNYGHRLRSRPYDLCIRCHSVDALEDHDGNKMLNFKKHFEENPNRHGPVAAKECSTCHKPHGADVDRLLIAPFPSTFYMPYRRQQYTLCYKCHFEDLIEAPETNRTGFRDGRKSDHFVHVVREEKGRSCRVCHAVHASNQAFHIRESIPYGTSGWELHLNFSQTADGGSCEKTCHDTREYHRADDGGTPSGGTIRNRQMKTVTGSEMPLLNPDGVSVLLFLRPDQEFSKLTLRDLADCSVHFNDKRARIAAVVPEQYPVSAVTKMMSDVGSDLPILVDTHFEVELEAAVKAYPEFLIIDRNGVLKSRLILSKNNTCRPLVARLQYALGELSEAEAAALSEPPSPPANKDDIRMDRYIGLATVLLKNKQYEKAGVAANLALQYHPDSVAAQAILKTIAVANGDRPVWTVSKTAGRITIDGNLEEVQASTPLQIKSGNAVASFWTRWDSSYLYTAVRVRDDALWAPEGGRDGKLRESDGIEILLDPFPGQKEASGQMTRRIIVTVAGDLLDAGNVGGTEDRSVDMGVVSAVAVRGTIGDFHPDNGYDIELSIPWKSVGIAPEVGKRLGGNFGLYNADESAVSSANWAGIGAADDPSLWNELELTAVEAKEEPAPLRKSAATPNPPTTPRDNVPATGCGCALIGQQASPHWTALLFQLVLPW